MEPGCRSEVFFPPSDLGSQPIFFPTGGQNLRMESTPCLRKLSVGETRGKTLASWGEVSAPKSRGPALTRPRAFLVPGVGGGRGGVYHPSQGHTVAAASTAAVSVNAPVRRRHMSFIPSMPHH